MRSRMCPTEASTSYSSPRYLAMVFAFAGDSTMTSFFVPGTVLLDSWALCREVRGGTGATIQRESGSTCTGWSGRGGRVERQGQPVGRAIARHAYRDDDPVDDARGYARVVGEGHPVRCGARHSGLSAYGDVGGGERCGVGGTGESVSLDERTIEGSKCEKDAEREGHDGDGEHRRRARRGV